MWTIFPFSAVVGQEDVKKALIWNLINPKIGGVLLCGDKGTAKSTLVRGLKNISLGKALIEIPLNITEDCLFGGLDIEKTVLTGEKIFQPGILAKANKNILYVDEINLLSDYITKGLLEVSTSHVNRIEREGISCCHESSFILIGSMNPEEGPLRPQILERFGLYVEVKTEQDMRVRSEVVRRYLAFERADNKMIEKYFLQDYQLVEKIKKAQLALERVEVTDNAMQMAVVIAKEAHCEGHRAEWILIETAKAIAASDERRAINISDIKTAAKFVLPHRSREISEEQHNTNQRESNDSEQNLDQGSEENQSQDDDSSNMDLPNESQNRSNSEGQPETSMQKDEKTLDGDGEKLSSNKASESAEENFDIGEIFSVNKWMEEQKRLKLKKGTGKRNTARIMGQSKQGKYSTYRPIKQEKLIDIAFDATVRAAAPYQAIREKNGMAIHIKKADIQVKVREKRTGNGILFVVDASGSMGANRRMKSVKGAIMSLLNDAYQKRDEVGLIAFRKQSAEVLLGMTRSIDLAQKKLVELPTGGRTPLESGLDLAYEVISAARVRNRELQPVIVLVSDGKATYSKHHSNAFQGALKSANRIRNAHIKAVVIDADQSFIKLNFSESLAQAMNAELVKIEDLKAESLVETVKWCL